MDQTIKKPKIVLAFLLSLIMVLCCFTALVPTSFKADESVRTQWVTKQDDWYVVKYSKTTGKLDIQLSDKFIEYTKLNGGELKEFASAVTSALKEIVMEGILGSAKQSDDPQGANILYAEGNDNGDGTKAPSISDFDWDSEDINEQLKQFKGYIEDRLSDVDELNKYLSGDYNMLVEQAIGQYIEGQTKEETTDDEKKELYDKIGDAIEKLVDKAIDDAADALIEQEIKETLGDSATKEQIEQYKKEHYTEDVKQQFVENKKQESKDIVQKASEKVEENGGKPPAITVDDIVKAFMGLSVDGNQVYHKLSGINTSGVKKLLSYIPRPGEIAEMTSEQLKKLVDIPVSVDTTFGSVNIEFSFGFFGETQAVQKLAKYAANHLDVQLDGHELTVNARIPEFVSSIFLKITETNQIDDTTKNRIFALFGKTVNEIADYVEGFDYDEFIEFLKSIPFRKFFNNFLNAEYVNDFFHNAFERVLGKPLSQENINTVVDKFVDIGKKLGENGLSYEDARDFLYNRVPGFRQLASKASEQKIKEIIEKLQDIAKKINWEDYDSDKILDTLANSTTFDDSIIKYIDELADLGLSVYDKLIDYVEKVFDFLPERLMNKSLLSMYDGNNAYSHKGTYTIRVGEIINKFSRGLSLLGLDQFADIFKSVATASGDKSYTVDLNFNMTVPQVYKIEFYQDEESAIPLRSGLLPVDATLGTFAPAISDSDFISWALEDSATPITQMPAEDTKLYARYGLTPVDPTKPMVITITNVALRPVTDGSGYDGDGNIYYVYDGTPKTVEWHFDIEGENIQDPTDTKLRSYIHSDPTGGRTQTAAGTYEETVTLSLISEHRQDVVDGKLEVKIEGQDSKMVDLTENQFTDSWQIVNESDILDLDGLSFTYNGRPYNGENLTYDGRAKEFKIDSSKFTNDQTALFHIVRNLEVTYYTNVNDELGEKLSGPFVDAGSYYVTVEAKAGTGLILRNAPKQAVVVDRAVVETPTVTIKDITLKSNKWTVSYETSENENYTLKVTGTTESEKAGQFDIKFEFTLTNANYYFADETATSRGTKMTITRSWGMFLSGGITVVDIDGVVPKGYTLAVPTVELDIDDYKESMGESFADKRLKLGVAYDIHFNDKNGVEAEGIVGKFKVIMPLPGILDKYGDDVSVLHISGDDSSLIDVTKSGNNVSFTTDGFSIFAIFGFKQLPKPVGDWWLIVLIVILAILLILAIVLIIMRALKQEDVVPAEQAEEETVAEEQAEELVEESVEEEPIVEAEPEPAPEPIIVPEPIDEATATDEPIGPPIIMVYPATIESETVTYNKSFVARLSQSENPIKNKYNELKNHLLAYRKVRARLSWRFETFRCGREKICRLQFKGKNLVMYIALDPDLLDAKYHHKNVKDIKRFALMPTMLKIKSNRSFNYALELIDKAMAERDIKLRRKFEPSDFIIPYKTIDELVGERLIRVRRSAVPSFWNSPQVDEAAATELDPAQTETTVTESSSETQNSGENN